MTKYLKIGLVHLDVKYKDPRTNRALLIKFSEHAAVQGAKIVVNTEMAVSGYSFANRRDVLPFAENASGPTVSALAEVSRKHGVYIAAGLPERDELTGIMYNSAFVIGPDGAVVCRYRKINAEARWACPGSGKQNAVFDTPWGRVGVLICSDSYYGLIPRTLALKGADMVIIPANWPSSGLDPIEMWRARALENGFVVAACNRTGQDRMMDCSEARSCVISQTGEVLISESSPDSRVFFSDIPLDGDGCLNKSLRENIMQQRKPGYYGDIYLDLRMIRDMSTWYELPEPGQVRVSCIMNTKRNYNIQSAVEKAVKQNKGDIPHLILLPKNFTAKIPEVVMQLMSQKWNVGVAAVIQKPDRAAKAFFAGPKGSFHMSPFSGKAQKGSETLQALTFGHAKAAFVEKDTLTHPETSVALAKQGCDLILISEDKLSDDDCLLMGSRTLDHIAIAASSQNHAGFIIPPEGHGAWKDSLADEDGICGVILNTGPLRAKLFQERINYPLLLQQPTLANSSWYSAENNVTVRG